jgi:hypothetical protein
MTTRQTAARSLLIMALMTLMLAACGKSEKPKTGTPEPSPPSQIPTTRSADTGAVRSITVKTPDDKRLVAFHVGGGMKIEIGEGAGSRVLRGTMRDTGKRKYEIEGGPLVAEVKSDEDAFKLRTADGKLLWKVKLTDDKIKISDNEGNLNPYVISMRDDGVKVKENDTDLGEVKVYADRGKIKVKDAAGAELFESNSGAPSAMYAPLLMRRIPDTERYIIMAELAARGR